MPHFELIDARPYHCGQIVRRLRHDMHCAFFALGVDPHRELRTCFDVSYLRRAWLIDGKLAGLGGVFGGALSSAGYIWLALTQEATRYPVAMLKEARRQVAEIGATKHTLIASTLAGDDAAERFIMRLGFELHHAASADARGWIWRRSFALREAA
jgi:hypothetical protein